MRWLLLCAAWMAVLVAPGLRAQGTFDARLVRDDTSEPLAGAVVSIVGAAGTARTDADGRLTWAPAPGLPFQLIVVLAGGQMLEPVTVSSLSGGQVTIRVRRLADEPITVLGVAPSIDSAPGSALTVLSRTHLAQRTPEHLMQALETVPGISQVSEGHAAVPAVRGLAGGRTLFLVDGGRVTAERRVGPSGTFLDPAVIDGIDVARGPGSVAYGSDAIGGVISVRTRRAEPNAPLRVRGTATLGAGTPQAQGSVEVSKGLAQGGVLVHAHARNAEDYRSPEGDVFNSGWEDRGVLLNVTHAIARGFLSAAWQSDYGRDVERPRNNSRAIRFSYPFENSHRLTASYETPAVGGFDKLALTGFIGSHRQRTDQDRLATALAVRSLERADVSAKDFHVKASAERRAAGARLRVGVDVNGRFDLEALEIRQAFTVEGAVRDEQVAVAVDDARRRNVGAYAEAESPVGGSLRLAGGLRADRVTTRNTGGFFGERSTAHATVSGFAAATLRPDEHFDLTAQVARGFRDPVLSDRYYRGPSGRGFITGNPDLRPETTLQFDLSARYTLGPTQLAVYAYDYRISDIVERFQTEPDMLFFRNRDRARLRGVELEARSSPGRGYSVELGAQFSRGAVVDGRTPLDDISPTTVSVLGRKEFSPDLHAQTRVAWSARDDRPGPSEVVAPGATIWDAGGSWRVLPMLELRALGRNLLDEVFYASPDPRFVLAPGRSVTVTAAVEF